jgi:hypothetical protein
MGLADDTMYFSKRPLNGALDPVRIQDLTMRHAEWACDAGVEPGAYFALWPRKCLRRLSPNRAFNCWCASLELIRPIWQLLDEFSPPSIVTSMARSTIKSKITNVRVFEEAREAIIKLESMSRMLTRAELETLEILFDKHATALISKSLQEADQRKYEPIANIR